MVLDISSKIGILLFLPVIPHLRKHCRRQAPDPLIIRTIRLGLRKRRFGNIAGDLRRGGSGRGSIGNSGGGSSGNSGGGSSGSSGGGSSGSSGGGPGGSSGGGPGGKSGPGGWSGVRFGGWSVDFVGILVVVGQ